VSDLERTALTQSSQTFPSITPQPRSTERRPRLETAPSTGPEASSFPTACPEAGSLCRFAGRLAERSSTCRPMGVEPSTAKLALVKRPAAAALLSGNVTLSDATLPFAAFIKAATQSSSPQAAQIPLAFDVSATVGKTSEYAAAGMEQARYWGHRLRSARRDARRSDAGGCVPIDRRNAYLLRSRVPSAARKRQLQRFRRSAADAARRRHLERR